MSTIMHTICTPHLSESSALNHRDDLQLYADRFVVVVENIDKVGEWLVIYDEAFARVDRNILKAAQAVIN